jgi:flagellar biosynthetic protein FliQ
MTEAEVLDILRQGLWTALVISLPILAVALAVGLGIGLLQALTSVQEMTLTFVPKLGAILVVFWISMSFSGQTLVRFYQDQIIPMVVGR